MDSNYNVIATINDISTNSINKKFTFSKDEYNLKENDVYIDPTTIIAIKG